MPTVDCYFDYSSPFAYLGTTQIERVAAEHDARVSWKPFFLGGLFKEIGTPLVPLQAMPDVKRRYLALDMTRWAEHWGVPFRFTSHFPQNTIPALRLTLAAPEDRRAALIHRVMKAVWAEDRNAKDPDVLAACLADVGLPPSLLERTQDPAIKQALKDATDHAVALGVPGAPCFVVDGQLYWGQDRLAFVGMALAGNPPGPVG
ncbi:MAG: 2-hydroxychromene-2-carboxylate isomerase [Sandaracinaceae bacterium]